MLGHVRTLPHGFSWLREKGGRFLENGGTFHYEATAEDFEGGLVEMASPECRDPFTLVAHERAKDERVEELCDEVNLQLELAGYRGRARIGKNSVDSQGHTLGSHESYWVEDRLPAWRLALLVPVWAALWLVSLPVVAWLFALRIGLLVTVLGAGAVLLGTGALLRLIRPALGQRLFAWMERFARDLEQHPGELARRVQRLAAPLYPLMRLHSAVYDRFHFRAIRRDLTAHLVTRTLYTGAGALAFDGGPLFRLAQRPPFLKVLARIFPDDDARPLYEMRDLFFQPWSALRARRRLHLLIGDANMSEWAQTLRVGATALALEVIEDGTPEGWPVLARPLEALQAINVDPELARDVRARGRQLRHRARDPDAHPRVRARAARRVARPDRALEGARARDVAGDARRTAALARLTRRSHRLAREAPARDRGAARRWPTARRCASAAPRSCATTVRARQPTSACATWPFARAASICASTSSARAAARDGSRSAGPVPPALDPGAGRARAHGATRGHARPRARPGDQVRPRQRRLRSRRLGPRAGRQARPPVPARSARQRARIAPHPLLRAARLRAPQAALVGVKAASERARLLVSGP